MNKTSISESKIEQMLLQSFRAQEEKRIAENSVENKKNKNTFIDNSKLIKKKLEKLKDLYIDDLIDKETYKKDYTKLIKDLEENEQNKLQYVKSKPKDLSYLKELLNSDYEKIYHSLSPIDKRNVWLNVIDYIYFDGVKIERIIFK